MRSTWLALFHALIGSCACAAPSWAQDMTLADLVGRMIEMGSSETRVARVKSIVRNQTATFSIQMTMAADGSYKLVNAVRVNDEKTGLDNRSWTVSGRLGQPADFRDGKMIFLFEDGALVRLRTLREGGHKTRITFKRTPEGLTCDIAGGYAPEVGVGKTTSAATSSGNLVEIFNVKQQGKYCRLSPAG